MKLFEKCAFFIPRTCMIAEINPQKMISAWPWCSTFDHTQTYVRILCTDYSSACNTFVLSQQTFHLGFWLPSLIRLPTNSQLHYVFLLLLLFWKQNISCITYIPVSLQICSSHHSIVHYLHRSQKEESLKCIHYMHK